MGSPAEIAYLDDALNKHTMYVLHQNILRFEISVDDSMPMHEVYSSAQLIHYIAGLILRKTFALFEQVSQLPIRTVFQQQIELLFIVEVPIQLDDVLVS